MGPGVNGNGGGPALQISEGLGDPDIGSTRFVAAVIVGS
jgi:hypothetical protein